MASHGDGACPHCGANLAYESFDGKTRSRAWVEDVSDEYGHAAWVFQCPECGNTWQTFESDTRAIEWDDIDEFPPISL